MEETHLHQARASLQQALNWYSSFRRHWNYPPNIDLQALVRKDLQSIKAALNKLEDKVIRIAAFGLVSRGKSAVINALIGEKIFATGPINGITQWPKSTRWLTNSNKVQVELIDTPGLDEIQGEARAQMAIDVAREADLILFVVAGDITATEYEALRELRQSHKPILLVFNKIDLYPEVDRDSIYGQLQKLGTAMEGVLSPEEIIMVAAEPPAVPVRTEWPDGRVSQEWETPPPIIEPLRQKLLDVLNREGRSLLAINALTQAKLAQVNIAYKTVEFRAKEAEEIIWKYAKYKALAIAINPIGILDIVGGTFADLLMIRDLARLYGLPITSYDAGRLWRKIIFSGGSLIVGEVFSSVMLGLGKTTIGLFGALENPTAFTLYSSAAMTQASIAAYGSYTIGKAAIIYLQQGCSWGPLGASTVIQEILSKVDRHTLLFRLRGEEKYQSSN